jgi:hypothetical protein
VNHVKSLNPIFQKLNQNKNQIEVLAKHTLRKSSRTKFALFKQHANLMS